MVGVMARALYRGLPRGVMVRVLGCRIVVSEFELQSRHYLHFRTNTLKKDINTFILTTKDLIAPLLFFLKNGFGIEYPNKVDMPLHKRTKPNLELYKFLEEKKRVSEPRIQLVIL